MHVRHFLRSVLIVAAALHAELAWAQLEALLPGGKVVVINDKTPVKKTKQPVDIQAERANLEPSDEVVDVLNRGDVVTVIRNAFHGNFKIEHGVTTTSDTHFCLLVSRGKPGVIEVSDVKTLDAAESIFTDELKKWFRDKKHDKDLYLARAKVRSAKNDDDNAIADLNLSLKADPKNVEALLVRSEVWRGKRDFDKALADANDAIRLKQTDDSAYLMRGRAYAAQKNEPAAMEDFNRAAQLDPRRATAFAEMGVRYQNNFDWNQFDAAKFDRAIACLDRALTLDPFDHVSTMARSQLYARHQDPEKAIQDARTAHDIAPYDGATAANHVGVLFNLRRFAETVTAVDELMTRATKAKLTTKQLAELSVLRYARMMRAASLSYLGKGEEGLAEMNELLAANPADPTLYQFRAGVYKALQDDPRADADIRRAGELIATRPTANPSPR